MNGAGGAIDNPGGAYQSQRPSPVFVQNAADAQPDHLVAVALRLAYALSVEW